MRTNKQKILSRAKGTITIDIPPIPFPTPITAARWCVTNPVMRALFFVAVGVGIGHFWHSTLSKVSPAPVITVTETLEAFAARESQGLTADERQKLIAVTETILRAHFDTPSEMREAFRYERRKSEIDSPMFTAFNDKWTARIEQTAEDSVVAMRSIYESLLRGLKVQAYSDFTDEVPAEEVVNGSLLNVTPPSENVSDSSVSPPATDVDQTTERRQRLFIRR